MRDWRNRQTRTFKGRVGDRVSSSLTSRTTAPRFSGCFIFKTALLRALTLLLRQQNRTPRDLMSYNKSILWGYGSDGRAMRSQRIGHGFESRYLHHNGGLDLFQAFFVVTHRHAR